MTKREPKYCLICAREIDVPDDRLSLDCGGDCLGCMEFIEHGTKDTRPKPDFIERTRRLYGAEGIWKTGLFP